MADGPLNAPVTRGGCAPAPTIEGWRERFRRMAVDEAIRAAEEAAARRPICSLCREVPATCSGPYAGSGPAKLRCAECCQQTHLAGTCVPVGPEARETPARPTFNHTREDSALSPCSECAAVMSPSDLARAYRRALVDLLDMVQADDPTHVCRGGFAPCCLANRLLNATAVNRDQGAGVPSGAAVAPTGPGGGPETSAGSPVGLPVGGAWWCRPSPLNPRAPGLAAPDDERCARCMMEKREHPEAYGWIRNIGMAACFEFHPSGTWHNPDAAASPAPPAGGKVWRGG